MATFSKKTKITDQLEGVEEDERPDDFDPDRRQSVASASNIVLQGVDGKELGPEADEATKAELKKQLERAGKRRQ